MVEKHRIEIILCNDIVVLCDVNRLLVPAVPVQTTQLVWQSTRVTITNAHVRQDIVEGTAK